MRSRSTEPLTAEQAYNYALRLLTGRDYTAAKLGQKLAVRGVAADVVEDVVQRLQQGGFLDDLRFAERFASAALASGRFAGARLRVEMRKRGFTADVATEVLAPLLAAHDEFSEVRSVLQRRYPGFSSSTADDREKRRIIGYLQRRGFGYAAIMQALRAEE